MFLSRNKKTNVYPCKPVLLYKSGVSGGQNYVGLMMERFSLHATEKKNTHKKKKKKKKKKQKKNNNKKQKQKH